MAVLLQPSNFHCMSVHLSFGWSVNMNSMQEDTTIPVELLELWTSWRDSSLKIQSNVGSGDIV